MALRNAAIAQERAAVKNQKQWIRDMVGSGRRACDIGNKDYGSPATAFGEGWAEFLQSRVSDRSSDVRRAAIAGLGEAGNERSTR